MAGSGRRAVASGLVGAIAFGGLGLGLAGCVSTQRKNERAKLVASRTLAGREPQQVRQRSRDVRVERVALVRSRNGSALVVVLRNRGEAPRTDVPIAVGVRGRDGRRTRLNGGRGLDWFQTHVPAIGPGATTTWVFTTRRALPAGRAYAVAGVATGPVVTQAGGTLPQIAAWVVRAGGGSDSPDHGEMHEQGSAPDRVLVALDNRSEIPQYGLQVYAVVRVGGRYVAAGKATVEHLATHGHSTARVSLFGTGGRHAVRVQALPTIFD